MSAAPPLLVSSSLTALPSFSPRGSIRLGPAVAKLPLLASLRQSWTMVSLVRILFHRPSHDQPPRRARRARLRPPRLQRFLPGPPSTLFRLCRFGSPPMRSHLLRPCLVHCRQIILGVPALLAEILPPADIEFLESAERYTHSDWASKQRAEPVTPPLCIFFLVDPRFSPTISSFTWHLTNAPRFPTCAL